MGFSGGRAEALDYFNEAEKGSGNNIFQCQKFFRKITESGFDHISNLTRNVRM